MNDNIIDVTGDKFTQKKFANFCTYIKSEDELVYIVTTNATIAIAFNKLCDELKQEKFDNFFAPNETFVFGLLENNVQMYVDTNDIIWWRKTTKTGSRLNKLFENIKINVVKNKIVKTTKSSKIYKIVAGVQDNCNITEIEFFEGDNKSCVEFINNYNKMWLLKTKFDDKKPIKFIINYENEEDLTFSKNWKTLDELKNEGVLIL